jgi:curli biogenesis system outer membrane secretion channel CsgG
VFKRTGLQFAFIAKTILYSSLTRKSDIRLNKEVIVPTDRGNPKVTEAIRRRAAELEIAGGHRTADSELLAAIIDETLNFDQVDERLLARCIESSGPEFVVDAILSATNHPLMVPDERPVAPKESNKALPVRQSFRDLVKRSLIDAQRSYRLSWAALAAAVVVFGVVVIRLTRPVSLPDRTSRNLPSPDSRIGAPSQIASATPSETQSAGKSLRAPDASQQAVVTQSNQAVAAAPASDGPKPQNKPPTIAASTPAAPAASAPRAESAIAKAREEGQNRLPENPTSQNAITTNLSGAVPGRRKITVLDFGYATTKTQVAAIFGTDVDVGQGIADQLVMQLLDGGDYRVIERQALEKVLKEQNFSNSDRADPATAVKIGRALGVDTIVIGDVTTFGRDDKHVGVGGGGNSGWGGKFGVGGIGQNINKAVVEVTARVVDVNTGEILASVTGHGEAQRKGVSMGGGGGNSWWNGGGGHVDFGSSNFQETIIGQAVKGAVADVAINLDTKAASLPPPTAKPAPAAAPVSGLVADASTPDIIVNVGSQAGVKVGDKLQIGRVVRVVKDPTTGKPLRTIEDPVGQLTVTSVDATSAVGTFSGSGTPKVGDTVKNN